MTDKIEGAHHWFTARKGSQLARWSPRGFLEGIIEVHPDHPPIMHWCLGKSEELKPGPTGEFVVPAYGGAVEISTMKFEWETINDPESWVEMKTTGDSK